MFVEPASNILTWGYLIDHLHLAFWMAALGIVWRFRHAVDAWAESLGVVREKTVAVERMVMETQGLTTQIRDNHLIHISEEIKDQKVTLDKHLDVLQSIDRNIAILAERALPLVRKRK